MTEKRQFATFYAAEIAFAVDLEAIQEIMPYQEITHVPLAPPVVSGLINVHGQIVTAIDLRRRLGMKDREAGRLPMNVVIRSGGGLFDLQVDEIGEVVEAPEPASELLPETLSGKARQFVREVYKLNHQFLHVLNTEALTGEDESKGY